MQTRIFSADDQLTFARLSGDYNELHLDPTAARRSLFGAPVVHGVNALLWALDVCLSERRQPCRLTKLKALFTHQIKLDETVHVQVIKLDDTTLRARIMVGDTPVTNIKATLAEPDAAAAAAIINAMPEAGSSLDLPADEIPEANGKLELMLDQALIGRLYPSVARLLDPLQTAAILGATRIVGMHCPGKHSLFSELELTATTDSSRQGLHYHVDNVDERFGLIEMTLSAPFINGVVRAFRRPEPQPQASLGSLRKLVKSGEFADQRAMVIGGSRGLGEVVTKLLIAGGAEVHFTYHSGDKEAAALLQELAIGDGQASYSRCNVLDPNPLTKAQLTDGRRPTHLYFFATPFIETGRPDQFSIPLFRRFCEFYVSGFARCIAALGADQTTQIFLPSSVMADNPPPNLQEYSAAKNAAEMMADFLPEAYPRIAVHSPRLPRMATDQTANVAAVQSDDPAPVMLRELRDFLAAMLQAR